MTGGVLDWMMNPMDRDDETNLEAILHGVTAYRLADKASDLGMEYLKPKDEFAEQNEKLDIMLKRRQLDLMDSDDYNKALNDDGKDLSLKGPMMLSGMNAVEKWRPKAPAAPELQNNILQSILSGASKESEANPLIGLLHGGSKNYGPVRSPVSRSVLARIIKSIE